MARRRTAAERGVEVTVWRASGESATRFAARRGYSTTSLWRWVAAHEAPPRAVRTARTGRGGGGARSGAAAGFADGSPRFARLEVAGVEGTRASVGALIVEVGRARIRVGGGFDAGLLGEIVAALGAIGEESR